jgi:hypothetical protein
VRCALLLALVACGPGVPPIEHTPAPPDRPTPAEVHVSLDGIATPDGAYVFDRAASLEARRALFREVDTGKHVGAPNAPIPRWIVPWSAGHGYVGVHEVQTTEGLAHTVTSVDLDLRRRAWQRHRRDVWAIGRAGPGARVWVSTVGGIELLRVEDGVTVAMLPAASWVDGSGAALVLASSTSIAVFDPLDGASICSVEVSPISALVVEGELVRISDTQAVSVRDCAIVSR